MKQFCILAILWAFMTKLDLRAQDFPCIRGILTDPFGPSVNPERQSLANTFNWMIDGDTEEFLIKPINTHYPAHPNQLNKIASPWYEQNNFIEYLRQFGQSDFLPSEGWELLARDFGFNMDGSETTGNDVRPFIILYNKYTGMMRILATTPPHSHNSTAIKIGYNTSSIDNNLGGVFRNYENRFYGLEKKTNNRVVTAPVRHPNLLDKFFHTDIPINYDPCTCFFDSKLEWYFQFINTTVINMKGASAGTDTPITFMDSNNSPIIEPTEFLSSVVTDYNDFSNVGVQTYHTIDNLISQFNTIANDRNRSNSFKDLLEGFGNLLKIGSSWVPVVGQGIDQKLVGLKAIFETGAETSKFLAGRVGGGNIAMPMVTQTESVFSGHLTTINEQSGFVRATPGSLNSQFVPESDYPIYNEVLGVMSVLETPQIIYSERKNFDAFFGYTGEVVFGLGEAIKYKLNPVLPIDDAFSKIWGSYYIKYPKSLGPVIYNAPLSFLGEEEEDGIIYEIYKSPLISINCLKEYAFSMANLQLGPNNSLPDYSKIIIDLQIIASLQFTTMNRANLPNEAMHIFTMATEKNFQSDFNSVLPSSNYDLYDLQYRDLEINDYSSNSDLFAWNTITVDGLLENQGSSNITFSAGGSILLKPGTTVKPGFILKTDYPINCSPGESILDHEVSNSYINNFCTSGIYKANQPTARLAEIIEEENRQEEEKDGASIYIYPNPATHTVNVDWSELEDPVSDVQVIDLTGREMLRFESPKGRKLDFSTSGLNENIYIIRIHTGTEIITRKVIIQH